MTEQCIPLAGSVACQAFNASSISTDSTLKGLLYVARIRSRFSADSYSPFLNFVSDAATFDSQFNQYIATTYSQQK
jgi:hypothetical protein